MQRLSQLSYTTDFVAEECIHCFAPFAISNELYRQRHEDLRGFYCPACGKSMVYRDSLKDRQLREAKAEAERARNAIQEAELRARRAEGNAIEVNKAYLKIRNRVRKGMCPCCNETFQNLAQHMQAKHPEFGAPDLLRTLREAYGLTQAALAKEIAVAANYISNYETGRHVASWSKRLIDAWLAKQVTP